MATDKNFKQAVLDYGELFIEEVTKQLLLNNKKATGDLIDSLDYRVVETADGIVLDILANKYLTVVDQGLKPAGKLKNIFPDAKGIIKWVKIKNLKARNKRFKTNEDLGWAIARSISKKGIKPSNVIKRAKASFLSNKEALNRVIDGANVDVKALIKEALKNLNN